MTPQEIDAEIRETFTREFKGTQDARTKLHGNFAEQGVKIIEYRKELIKTIAIISAGLIATPKFLDITPNSRLYLIGLCLLIFTIVFSLLNSKENIDFDEAEIASTRSKLLPIMDRRLSKIKEYQAVSSLLTRKDSEAYRKYRETEDDSDEMKKLKTVNENAIQNLHIKAIDYPSAFIMLLFASGAFFIAISILFPSLKTFVIICSEIIIIFITITNFSSKTIKLFSKIVTFLKTKIARKNKV